MQRLLLSFDNPVFITAYWMWHLSSQESMLDPVQHKNVQAG